MNTTPSSPALSHAHDPVLAKSRTVATWLALVGGTLGLHRFYLHGLKDLWGWLHGVPLAVGLWGLWRARTLGIDDPVSWIALPFLGLVLAAAMLQAIVIGLSSDERWHARFNPQKRPTLESDWLRVVGVAVSLMLGATVLMATIAYAGQRYFEDQVEQGLKMSQ